MKKLLLALTLAWGLVAPANSVISTTAVGDKAYTILSTDVRIITTTAFSAARTWTLPSAGATCIGQTCPANSLEIIDASAAISATNTLTLAPASGETINGSTASLVLPAPNVRVVLVPTSGTNWYAQVSYANTQLFTTAGAASYVVPLTVSNVTFYMCGGGGGGGAGFAVASGTAAAGAGGGGGGDCKQATFRATDLTSPVTLTIGAGGAGGLVGTLPGQVGGNTCLGGTAACGGTPLLTAFGGGGGGQGVTGAGNTGGGGGGGCSAVGAVGTASAGAAGDACASAGSTSAVGTVQLLNSGGAGGAGAAANGAAGQAGGIAWSFASPGGGSGGGVTTAPAATAGGNGGASQGCATVTTGGAAGVAGGSTAGSSAALPGCGGAGGGSQLGQTGAAGAGGAGTKGGGGGGAGSHCNSGGSCTTQTIATGGAGGAGYIYAVAQ